MIKKLLFALAVILLVLFCLIPFIQMLSVSLKYSWDWGNPSLIPLKINWEAYRELLFRTPGARDPFPIMSVLLEESGLDRGAKKQILDRYMNSAPVFPFGLYFRNTFILAFLSSLGATFLGAMGAYSLERLTFPGRRFMGRYIIFAYLLGGILLLIPLYKMSAFLGLLGSRGGVLTALIAIYLIQVLPVTIYLLSNYFRAIPTSLDEAGLIDGLTRPGTLFRLIIPLSRSALATVFIYGFIIVWNDYLFASVYLKSYPDLYTLSLGLRGLFYSKNAIWDRIMAASLLTALPVILLFWAIQDNLERGFTEGLKE